jgi:hypothetical protein
MHPDDRKVFNFNPRTIDWRVLSSLNLYGIQKYYFKMDVSAPYHEQNRLISPMNINYLQDARDFIAKTNKI